MTRQRERILPGTESLGRYAWDKTNTYLGIRHYGTQLINGARCFKVGSEYSIRLASLGWRTVKQGSSYIYVTR